MPEHASSEIILLRHQREQSTESANNQLTLRTAEKKELHFGLTIPAKDAVLLALSRHPAVQPQDIVQQQEFLISKAALSEHIVTAGKQHTALVLEIQKSPSLQSTTGFRQPILTRAAITGRHVGNNLPSTPRPLSLNRAGIAASSLAITRTQLKLLNGAITERLVESGNIRNSKELPIFIHHISPASLPQGKSEYTLQPAGIEHSVVLSGQELSGKELTFTSASPPASLAAHAPPELLRASKEGQLIPAGESKFDESFTAEATGYKPFDEQIILTITRAREFIEHLLLRSPRSESLTEPHRQLELVRASIERGFVLAGALTGKEINFYKHRQNASALEAHPLLEFLRAIISGQSVQPERTEKLRQFELAASPGIESTGISYTALALQNAAVTGKHVGKDLSAVPQNLPLRKASVNQSSIINPINMPFSTAAGIITDTLFGSGNSYGMKELLISKGLWTGAFRFDESVHLWGTKSISALDLTVLISMCKSLDESITIERTGYISSDETIHLGKTTVCDLSLTVKPCKSLDERISLSRAGLSASDEQISLIRNYMHAAKVDEIVLIIPKALLDEVVTLTAAPSIATLDESMLAQRSSLGRADETLELVMSYVLPSGESVPAHLRNASFDESITLIKTEFDETITIYSDQRAALLGDVVRDSDFRAKGIIVHAGQDFVLEQ